MFYNDLIFIADQTLVFDECRGSIFIQIGSLRPTILFIHETIEVKMCFTCKPDAPNTKSITISHCEHSVHKTQPLLHISLLCDANFA